MDKDKLASCKARLHSDKANWYEYLTTEGRLLDRKIIPCKNNRGYDREILFISKRKWLLSKYDNEIISWEKRINSFGFHGAKKPRSLWLPTVIYDADVITVDAYPSYSVKKLPSEQAAIFVAKYKLKFKVENNRYYKATITTGLNYKFRVESFGEPRRYPLSKWAVCVCNNDEIPSFKNLKIKKNINESSTNNARITIIETKRTK